MKKIQLMLFSAAMVLGTSAYAGNVTSVENDTVKVAVTQTTGDEDVYVDVKLEDLNEAVQTAIKGFMEDYDVKTLGYNTEKQLTKVTLSAKADQAEKIVILNDEGEEQKEEKEVE